VFLDRKLVKRLDRLPFGAAVQDVQMFLPGCASDQSKDEVVYSPPVYHQERRSETDQPVRRQR
jgi:hypothetical protein